MVTILAGLAEFERELILARTSDGRARAKARGVKFGRPTASHIAPTAGGHPEACAWRSTGRCSAVFQCLTGDHLKACSSLTAIFVTLAAKAPATAAKRRAKGI